MKTIIVYYSRSGENYVNGAIKKLEKGNGEIIVNMINKNKDVTVFRVEPVQEYPQNYQECTKLAKQELQRQARPKITNYVHRFEEYDHVILVYPNWWSTMPMVMFTFLEMHQMKGKHIYPICSHEGSGLGRSVEDIKKLCPDSIVHEGLAICGSLVKSSRNIIKNYIEKEVMNNENSRHLR